MLVHETGFIWWELITFALLIVIIRVYAWAPMVKALQRREQMIRNSVEQAEAARRLAEESLDDNRQRLREVDRRQAEILDEARRAGKELETKLVATASEQTQRVVSGAQREIEAIREKVRGQLRVEAANLAVSLAERIVDESLDHGKHHQLVARMIERLPSIDSTNAERGRSR